jgi:LL-diaminopimelate aminotransferase
MKRIVLSDRINSLPPYIFARLEELKGQYLARGGDVIDLGLGDPDFSTPAGVVTAAKKQLDNPDNFHYPTFKGELALREKISRWYKESHHVDLDPETEVLVLLGSKEGLAHLPLTLLNPGDYGLVPDPGYPAYKTAVLLAGGTPYSMPLLQENRYLPVLADLPPHLLDKAKLMYLNYPNNPTSALADEAFFLEAIDFAGKNNIIICHDFAYSEVAFDGLRPLSFMAIPGAREVGVEFHSFSKTFAMTGWRIGFVVGNKEILHALYQVKSCMDSGVFKIVPWAALEALSVGWATNEAIREEYAKRRNLLARGLESLGWEFAIPKATYYFWVKIPDSFHSSMQFSEYLLERTGIMVTPGIGFGENGDRYIRIAINLTVPRIKETLARLGEL